MYIRTNSSDHSWESKSCSGIALQFSGARITWSWTDPEHWSFWYWVRNVWRGLLNELAGYQHPRSVLLRYGRLYNLISLCPSVKSTQRRALQTPVSVCPREKCSPESQGGAHYPEWEHCKLIGFARDQETELFPEAVTGGSTKINVPLFNTIKSLPLQKKTKKLATIYHSDPPLTFSPCWNICFCSRRLYPPLISLSFSSSPSSQ